MAMKLVVKSSRSRQDGAHAALVPSKTTVALRINKAGIEFLRSINVKLLPGDRVDVYHDPETGEIALLRSNDGQYEIKVEGSRSHETGRLMIYGMSAAEFDTGKRKLQMDKSAKYDVVLTPKS